MSLLKWKELAKSKSELGNKINYVHNLIKKHKIGQQTSQESFEKVFKPVTSKLDEVIESDSNLRMPQKRRPWKKWEVPNYIIAIDDEVENMNLGDMFGDYVPPQQEKQLGSIPEIVVDPPDAPPEYDDIYNENVDYEIPDEELAKEILNESGLDDYKIMDEKTKDITHDKMIFKKKIKLAKKQKQRLNGSNTNVKKNTIMGPYRKLRCRL